jgi:hypothetical protein
VVPGVQPAVGDVRSRFVFGDVGRDLNEWANARSRLRVFDEVRPYKQQGQTKVHIATITAGLDREGSIAIKRDLFCGVRRYVALRWILVMETHERSPNAT